MAFASRVRESVLQLTWSLWAELGVPGWTRLHQDWWIDPEPLLLFTTHVVALDARLGEEVGKWVDQHERFLSTGRLNGILKHSPRLGANASHDLLRHSHAGPRLLPRQTEKVREIRRELSFSRPAQLTLRLRALFGVSARAEALRVFLLRGDVRTSVRQMADDIVGFTKRAVQLSLEDLELAGVCAKKKSGNMYTYSLEQRNPIASLVSQRTLRSPRWITLLECIATALEVTRTSDQSHGTAETLRLRNLARGLDESVEAAELPKIPHEVRGNEFTGAFQKWCLDLVSEVASGSLPATRR
jgi:hypothetical protein